MLLDRVRIDRGVFGAAGVASCVLRQTGLALLIPVLERTQQEGAAIIAQFVE
ncbi:hypothetical protein ACRQ4B_03905 [Curtobacterium sp. SP.BCo]|uniref:hypothetical protein n=1 Tax=Curtobacterium sp. SP.BCo TaxID=3435229 RepID=UPI003F73DA2E